MNVTLLGPQRRVTAARAAVAELMPKGQIATVNAGWQERETDAGELADVLGGRMVNLELHRRWQEVVAADPDYAAAERRLFSLLTEIQALYAIRLDHAMSALQAVTRRGEMPEPQAVALEDARRTVTELDRWHLGVVAAARTDFYTSVLLGQREHILAHRAEIHRCVAACSGMVFAGGHVGVLLHVLHVFDLVRWIKGPLIAWSAGAMALSDRVVLFHDHTTSGHRHAEMYAEGLGVFSGVLPFPHPRRRLRLDDPRHLGEMARRFAPRQCVLLPDGTRVDLTEGQPLPAGSRWLSPSDGVVTVGGSNPPRGGAEQ